MHTISYICIPHTYRHTHKYTHTHVTSLQEFFRNNCGKVGRGALVLCKRTIKKKVKLNLTFISFKWGIAHRELIICVIGFKDFYKCEELLWLLSFSLVECFVLRRHKITLKMSKNFSLCDSINKSYRHHQYISVLLGNIHFSFILMF